MSVLSQQVDLGRTGFAELSLLDGEQVDMSLSLRDEPKDEHDTDTDLLLLTDRRLIHLIAKGRNREAVLVSLDDVSAVEVGTEHPGGYGGYVWGGISFLVAILLWRVWNQPVLDVVAAGVVALMGVYLIWDHMMAPLVLQATVRAGSSQLQMNAHQTIEPQRMYDFANRVFEVKARGPRSGSAQADEDRPRIFFAPR
jgi:hypothetical protein